MRLAHCAWYHLAVAGVFVAALTLSGAATVGVPAGQEVKVTVFVSHTGEDAAGLLFVKHLKAALAHSSSVALAETGDGADTALFLTTMEPDATQSGRLTTAGWTLVILKDVNVYLGSGLRFCERDQSQKAAEGLAAHVESLIKSRETQVPGSAARARYENDWNEAVERTAETLPVDSCGIKVQTAFREQMGTYLRLSTAMGLGLDVREVIKSVVANLGTDDDFARKIRDQAIRLGQCQAELAALKKK
jgi:pyrimidine deaminase RibD-like protein